MDIRFFFFVAALLAGPVHAKNTVKKTDDKVAAKVNALDTLLGNMDGKASKAHKAVGKRNANVVNTLFGKKGAQQVFGKDTMALLTGKDGLKGMLGKGGPIAKSQSLLKGLHGDYKRLGDRKKLRTVETMQKRMDRIKKTTRALSTPRSLLMEKKTVKRVSSLRKDVKAMRKDTRTLK